jgi:hypothetical protein
MLITLLVSASGRRCGRCSRGSAYARILPPLHPLSSMNQVAVLCSPMSPLQGFRGLSDGDLGRVAPGWEHDAASRLEDTTGG